MISASVALAMRSAGSKKIGSVTRQKSLARRLWADLLFVADAAHPISARGCWRRST